MKSLKINHFEDEGSAKCRSHDFVNDYSLEIELAVGENLNLFKLNNTRFISLQLIQATPTIENSNGKPI